MPMTKMVEKCNIFSNSHQNAILDSLIIQLKYFMYYT